MARRSRDAAVEEAARAGLIADLESAIDEVRRYEEALSTPAGAGGPTLRTLVERLVELREARAEVELTPAERALLHCPRMVGRPAGARTNRGRRSPRAGGPAVLASSPLLHLAEPVLAAARPDAQAAVAAQARAEADQVGRRRARARGPADTAAASPASVARAAALGAVVLPLAQRGQSTVLDRSSLAADALGRHVKDWQAAQRTLADRAAAAAGWRTPLPPDEARAALVVAQAHESSLLRFLAATGGGCAAP